MELSEREPTPERALTVAAVYGDDFASLTPEQRLARIRGEQPTSAAADDQPIDDAAGDFPPGAMFDFAATAADIRYAAEAIGEAAGAMVKQASASARGQRQQGAAATFTAADIIGWEDPGFACDIDEDALIEGIIPRVGTGLIFGKSQSFKTFVAFHVAISVALGEEWAGRPVKKGPVIYIAAEDAAGLKRRRLAYIRERGDDLKDLPLSLIQRAPNFGASTADAEAIIAAVKAKGIAPRLIIIDTLAQTMQGGDENGPGMSAFIASAQKIAQSLDCFVLTLHHTGHSEEAQDRPRGHSSLPGALDASLKCERQPGAMTATLTPTKLKNDPPDFTLTATLESVVIGTRQSGREVSTLIVADVAETGAVAAPKKERTIPPRARLFMQVLADAIDEAGEPHTILNGPTVRAVRESIVRGRLYAKIAERPAPDDTPEKLAARQRKAFNDMTRALLNAQTIFAGTRDGERILWNG